MNTKEKEVLNLTFQPLDPMVILYRPIVQLTKLAMSTGIPSLTAHQIKMGISVFRNTRDFETGLGTWNARPTTEKT